MKHSEPSSYLFFTSHSPRQSYFRYFSQSSNKFIKNRKIILRRLYLSLASLTFTASNIPPHARILPFNEILSSLNVIRSLSASASADSPLSFSFPFPFPIDLATAGARRFDVLGLGRGRGPPTYQPTAIS